MHTSMFASHVASTITECTTLICGVDAPASTNLSSTPWLPLALFPPLPAFSYPLLIEVFIMRKYSHLTPLVYLLHALTLTHPHTDTPTQPDRQTHAHAHWHHTISHAYSEWPSVVSHSLPPLLSFCLPPFVRHVPELHIQEDLLIDRNELLREGGGEREPSFLPSVYTCKLTHTALLHLNPLPNATCNTRCPRLRSIFSQMYSISYQIDELLVLP